MRADLVQVQLCYNPTGCSLTGCYQGVHLPTRNVRLDVYHTPSGNVWHQDRSCPKLTGRSVRTTTTHWQDVKSHRCSSCSVTPPEVASHDEAARAVARAAKAVLVVEAERTGALDAEAAARVERGQKALAKRRHPALLKGAVEEVLELAETLLAAAGDGWAPDPLPVSVLRAAAVELVGVASDPHGRAGVRPATRHDRAAGRLWPAGVLDAVWNEWYRIGQQGGKITPDRLSWTGQDAHPGRDAAVADLVGAWEELADELEADPGPTWLVAVPAGHEHRRSSVGTWVLAQLEAHALCRLPRSPLGTAGETALVPVPQLVVDVLAQTERSNAALVVVPSGTDLTKLAETALTLWEGRNVKELRKAFEIALTLAAAES